MTDAETEAPILFGHLMQTANSLEKILMLGETEGRRRRERQRMRLLDGITDLMDIQSVSQSVQSLSHVELFATL